MRVLCSCAPMLLCSLGLFALPAHAQTTIRIVPVDGATIAAGSRFDIRVEATGRRGGAPPSGLKVVLDGRDVTIANILEADRTGEHGRGGTGTPDGFLPERDRAAAAPRHTTNYLTRNVSLEAGRHTLTASTADGATVTVTWDVFAWQGSAPPNAPFARNVILLLGDGLGLAARTAARAMARTYVSGKAQGHLAMDTMEATGLVMTSALNALITDSAPGMSSYVTGHKAANNMMGVYPDNTWSPRPPGSTATAVDGVAIFDNPRTEYLGALLRRVRGEGFATGLVTTADVSDATPGANMVYASNRSAFNGIASRYLDERDLNGLSVLLGGGGCQFVVKQAPDAHCGRADGRDLLGDFVKAGFTVVSSRSALTALGTGAGAPKALLGLFRGSTMSVAFDKIGLGTYSDELMGDAMKNQRDQPLLEEMTTAALATLSAHAPKGFYLMVEGASIDKQEHVVDAERAIWDVIEFDRAVAVALAYAKTTNSDADPSNDTLVIATADHETGGLGIVAVGNPHYAPSKVGSAVRDYAAVFRFEPDVATLEFFPNYQRDARGFPTDPDPSRKLLLGWAAAPDYFQNWLANRHAVVPTTNTTGSQRAGHVVTTATPATANARRDGPADTSVNGGRRVPGFLVAGIIENGATGCAPTECPPGTDTGASALVISGHTAADVPLSASGPGALSFTGTYDNTEVFGKILKLVGTR